MKQCQICNRRNREKAVVYYGMVYALCLECSDSPNSKFCGATDVSEHYNLDSTFLKDIKEDMAFKFKGINSGTIYMNIPNLPYNYQHRQVLNLETKQISSIGHDAVIELLPFE